MSDIQYARSTALFANGIFAGFSLCMKAACLPSAKASLNPTTAFRTLYKNGTPIGALVILVSSAANFYIYYRTRESRSLYLGLLSFASLPYTFLVMNPLNKRLFALDATISKESNPEISLHKKEALGILTKWNKLQLFKVVTSVSAFFISVINI
ncbi:hypothetical protein J3Q64DRAFT_1059439 [Phycomyces blakesleeanus]|uniref:DUF1772 domain-containing protein n=2 Tax=Phycomyces blakesleeanus TaxID=4837 RepID=A0A162V067_PHYB8|nr:hypothetical protein PHYBLDRAFT_139169 [Phycomyces blakesleeanus NRRL 1555(-)]OAD79132.1 hypothetical protein PHYBLDRAFT_139169 [Phycomyces blakesleeanus NRRL 1555(-)]|eukprot:XP_018297172.1 hypothetical protein PHYBLDRAFT_139169 [Phycomyces blakesleeanus NRRL 1555(-)]